MRQLLLIDAELDELRPLKQALEDQGVQVTHQTSGAQALAWAAANRPTCILLCVELLGVSGYAICNKLKKDPDLSPIPLVLASSQASVETFEEHRRLRTRADGYLTKPYQLEATLRQLAACAPNLQLIVAPPAAPPPPRPATGGVDAFSIPPAVAAAVADEGPVPPPAIGHLAAPHRPEPAWVRDMPQGAMGEALMSEDAQLLLEGSIDTHRDTQVIRLAIAPSGAKAGDLIGAALADMAAFPDAEGEDLSAPTSAGDAAAHAAAAVDASAGADAALAAAAHAPGVTADAGEAAADDGAAGQDLGQRLAQAQLEIAALVRRIDHLQRAQAQQAAQLAAGWAWAQRVARAAAQGPGDDA